MPVHEKHHLFVIMNDPCGDKLCLVVMVTTIYATGKYDGTCVLDVGDHPFITHPSFMLFRLAETIRASQIASLLGQNYYVTKDDFEPAVFKRIADGLYQSDETKRRILVYAEANGV